MDGWIDWWVDELDGMDARAWLLVPPRSIDRSMEGGGDLVEQTNKCASHG